MAINMTTNTMTLSSNSFNTFFTNSGLPAQSPPERCKHWRGPRSKIRCELPADYDHSWHFGVSRGKKYMWERNEK